MKETNTAAAEKNKKLDEYLEAGDYDKADEISRELCLLQGQQPVDKMPDNFLFLLKKKEQKEMKNLKKASKNFTKIAAAAAGILLVGTTASAAAIYRSTVVMFPNGLSSENLSTEEQPQFEGIKLPQDEAETEIIEEETAGSDHIWIEKKVWEETSTAYKSEDGASWTPYEVKDRITRYTYNNYSTAAKDAGFINAFTKEYSGNAYYTEYEHLTEETGENVGNKDYSITADFVSGSGTFTFEQQKTQLTEKNDNGNDSESAFTVITGDTTNNERVYAASTGYEYKLADDNELGKTRTTVIVPGKEYQFILTFTDMTEAEIYSVLESIHIKCFVDLP
ncbi:MAG: hypothetical protein J6D08_04475 [Lachnospiraceae bacterium]|nr:hypothetical protein [Lachnospiraceae bacterium]